MWYSCDLPNISDLLQMPQAGIESWAPFKAKVLVLITKSRSTPHPPPPHRPPILLGVWRPRGGGACHIWEGEVSLEAGGLEATEIMDLLWEKQFLIFTSGPTLLMKNSFA